jgi:cytochrome P450
MTDDHESPVPAFAPSGPAGEWVAHRYADVQAVLADGRFEVPQAPAAVQTGTIAWLRASVSRFTNGEEHQRRRALAVAEIAPLAPGGLRHAARERAAAALAQAAAPGGRLDVMAHLARRVPMAAMAAALGVTSPREAAEAAIAVAAAYFPGADEQAVHQADKATSQLVDMLSPAPLEVIVARIALLAQGCDATAGLIGLTLHLLQENQASAPGEPTDALLQQALRHTPVVRASRRVAREAATVGGGDVLPGDAVLCDIETANLDPAAFRPPELELPVLTFGTGLRPCPGEHQARALAAGVVDAVRENCALLPGQPVDYEPGPLRIPRRLDVTLR